MLMSAKSYLTISHLQKNLPETRLTDSHIRLWAADLCVYAIGSGIISGGASPSKYRVPVSYRCVLVRHERNALANFKITKTLPMPGNKRIYYN
jgi:hypothetical protein